MNDTVETVFFCFGLPVLLIGLAYLMIFEPIRRRRKKAVSAGSAWAKRHGWRYQKADNALVGRWQGEPFRNRGGAADVLYGVHRGRNIMMFTYGYHEAGVVTQSESFYTIVAVGLGSQRPWLQLKPRDEPRSHQLFDVFDIQSQDNQYSNHVFQSGLADWLLNDPRSRQQPVRFENADLLSWWGGPIDCDEAFATAEFLCDLADRVPDAARHH
ncbi:hypothetical protein [Stackebrandtia nassauensis]|uniref:DUF3137 domain-containing protein n=1 Tax=Stackebrandtia nassauensis (strain DSM 44728 / CIP 108903 / NRRL B-16338 / NBRC 102104 / LLR-40K-21) TaxID=446470 RepID=D3Q9P8_STANL|nr:hypothetical protein [Stackebrandtia nassauensis]ADD44594.1 hypothetical protein Snas_4954 [Stackebrandtia nassauensis DSM 44728]